MITYTDEEAVILIIGYIATGLSFLGLLRITYFFCKAQSSWTFSGKIVVCLTISYFMFTLSNFLIIFNTNTVICKIEGFLHTFSIISSFYWAWKISRTAYFNITDEYFRPDPKTRWIVLLRGFILPFLIALIPIIGFGQCYYGQVGRECAIQADSSRDSLIWDAGLIMAPTALGLAFITYYYIKIKQASQDLEDELKVYCDRFLVYPLGLFLVWLPSLAFRIALYFGGYIFWLDATRTGIEYSLGFVHALVCTLQGMFASGDDSTKEFSVEMSMGQSRAASEDLVPAGTNRSFDSFAL